jgi:hypothetical protein
MKRILFILSCLLLLTLTGCGLPQKVKTEEKQALSIAKTIPLPPSYYSSQSGDKMVDTPIKIYFDYYNADTGEPLFSLGFKYVDPKHHPNFFNPNPCYSQYWLCSPTNYNGETSIDSTGDLFPYDSINGKWYQTDFTLAELQQYEPELVWK